MAGPPSSLQFSPDGRLFTYLDTKPGSKVKELFAFDTETKVTATLCWIVFVFKLKAWCPYLTPYCFLQSL